MSPTDLIRWGAIGFMAGGVVWIVQNLVSLAEGPEAELGFLTPLLFINLVLLIIAILLTVGGLVGLHTLQKGNYGRIGQAGFYTILVFSAAQVLGTVVFLAGSLTLFRLVSPVGFLGMIVGFALYGAATLQARVLPRWCGVALIILLPVSIVLGEYGNIWLGLVLLALGYVLWSQRGTTAEAPSRVR